MEELIKKLKGKMDEMAEYQAQLHERKARFDMETKDLAAMITGTGLEIIDLKQKINPLAVTMFTETCKKKLYGGIGIRETSVLDYDQAKAFAFAKEKDMFLALDAKAFEKAAPGLGLDFVTTTKITKVTFPAVIEL